MVGLIGCAGDAFSPPSVARWDPGSQYEPPGFVEGVSLVNGANPLVGTLMDPSMNLAGYFGPHGCWNGSPVQEYPPQPGPHESPSYHLAGGPGRLHKDARDSYLAPSSDYYDIPTSGATPQEFTDPEASSRYATYLEPTHLTTVIVSPGLPQVSYLCFSTEVCCCAARKPH